MSTAFKYVYGPIVSKRLGFSLGIDIVPFKICNYDCIYCQLGRTKNNVNQRKEYVNINDVLAELKLKLSDCQTPDYISIVGSGEPTLNNKIGELITEIKKITKIPVAVITNGSLLYLKEVRNDLLNADLVIPSLDVGDEETFAKVNLPHKDISFSNMVDGIAVFTKIFKGKVWLEVLLLAGITDTDESVENISYIIAKIKPHKTQISTISRPPADDSIMPVSLEKLEKIAKKLGDNVEVIYHTPNITTKYNADKKTPKEIVLDLLNRHPSPDLDIARGLGISNEDTQKLLEELIKEEKVKLVVKYGQKFYTPTKTVF